MSNVKYWNYRVLRISDEVETEYIIVEAFYNDQDQVMYTSERSCQPYGETLEELRSNLSLMLKAVDKPILDSQKLKDYWNPYKER